MFLLEHPAADEQIRVLAEEWQSALARLTSGAVASVAAGIPLGLSLADARQHLRLLLDEQRSQRLLDQPSKILLPAGTAPGAVCEGCGAEPSAYVDQVGNETERIGEQCQARRTAGRDAHAPTLAQLFGQADLIDVAGSAVTLQDRPPIGSTLAAVYFDADSMGRRLGKLDTLDELGRLSRDIGDQVGAAVEAAKAAADQARRRLLAPIVGGDDVLLFLDAAIVPTVLSKVADSLSSAIAREWKLRFSASVVVADPYTPLRQVFGESRRALKAAKERAHRTEQAQIAVRSLLPARLHPGSDLLFGGPLPLEDVVGDGESRGPLMQLINDVAAISDRSQRAGLARDLLSGEGVAERELALLDRIVRTNDGHMQRALELARHWASVLGPGRHHHELLLGALALADQWRVPA